MLQKLTLPDTCKIIMCVCMGKSNPESITEQCTLFTDATINCFKVWFHSERCNCRQWLVQIKQEKLLFFVTVKNFKWNFVFIFIHSKIYPPENIINGYVFVSTSWSIDNASTASVALNRSMLWCTICIFWMCMSTLDKNGGIEDIW